MSTATATTSSTSTKTLWAIDPAHSEITFKVKHLMIANVKGAFKTFSAQIETPGTDFTKANIAVEIDAASIFTNEENRDNHLRSADFFDVEKHPTLNFVGKEFSAKGDDHTLTGELTIKGITHPVTLDVEFGGISKDPWGNEKAGFTVSGKINRKDWGLNWNAALETGGVLVSDEVRISAELQFVKQA